MKKALADRMHRSVGGRWIRSASVFVVETTIGRKNFSVFVFSFLIHKNNLCGCFLRFEFYGDNVAFCEIVVGD